MKAAEIKFKELTRPTGNELSTLTLEIVTNRVSIEVYLSITKKDADQFMKALHTCIETATAFEGHEPG
jgi:hypothetical protein